MPRIDEDRRLATKQVTIPAIREPACRMAERFPQLEAVWLFGSYARGEQRLTSDVDLAVMTCRDQCDDFMHKADLVFFMEDELGVPVDVVLLSTKRPLPLLWEALRQPVLLSARDPEDAGVFASGLRMLVRDHWDRLERRWEMTRRWLQELRDASTDDAGTAHPSAGNPGATE